MAFLTPRAGSPLTTAGPTSDSTSFNVNLAPHQAGDYLVVFIATDAAPTVTGTGWSLVQAQAQSTNVMAYCFVRDTVAASAAESNPVFSATSAQQFSAAAYSIPASAFNIGGGGASGLNTAPDPPNYTPSGGLQDYLWIAMCAINGGGSGISQYPGGYSNTATDFNGDGGSSRIGVAQLASSGTSKNPDPFTIGASIQWATLNVAIWGTPTGGGGGGGTPLSCNGPMMGI